MIKKYYVDLRNKNVSEERRTRAIPISARQLEALERLAEASARVRLAEDVNKEDARRAIELLHYCLMEVGMDKATGQIDIDRISTGIAATERGKIIQIREIIESLERVMGKSQPIPIEDILREGKEQNIGTAEIEETIERLKRSGDLFEPRRGYIQRI